jgi:hypothetical protein
MFKQHKSERERESTSVILSKTVERLWKKSKKLVSPPYSLAPDIQLGSGKFRYLGCRTVSTGHRAVRVSKTVSTHAPGARFSNIKSSPLNGLNLAA